MVGIAPIGITRVVSAERLSKTPLYKGINATAIDKKHSYTKTECILTDEGRYVVLVDTEDLGVGQLMLRVVIHIPDTDYPAGYRKEVVKINPYIIVTG